MGIAITPLGERLLTRIVNSRFRRVQTFAIDPQRPFVRACPEFCANSVTSASASRANPASPRPQRCHALQRANTQSVAPTNTGAPQHSGGTRTSVDLPRCRALHPRRHRQVVFFAFPWFSVNVSTGFSWRTPYWKCCINRTLPPHNYDFPKEPDITRIFGCMSARRHMT